MRLSDRRPVARPTLRMWSLIAALTLLGACAKDQVQHVVTKPTVVTEYAEVYRDLPTDLTDPIPYPTGLPERWTNNQLWDLVFDLYDTIDTANGDREKARRIVSGETND